MRTARGPVFGVLLTLPLVLLSGPVGAGEPPAGAAEVRTAGCAPSGWPGGGRGGQADGDSTDVAVSPGGRYVAFTSTASNLVPAHNLVGADTNDHADVYVTDLCTGAARRVSLGPTAAH